MAMPLLFLCIFISIIGMIVLFFKKILIRERETNIDLLYLLMH